MRRAHVEPELLDSAVDGVVTLPKKAGHHLATVLRLVDGAEVELFDGEGRVARGRFERGPPSRVTDLEISEARPELPPLVLAQALVRSSKLDDVIRRATELGASRIMLFAAERSQGHGGKDSKLERLLRIAQEASRQSERAYLPRVDVVGDVSAVCNEIRAFAGVAAAGVVGAERPLGQLLAHRPAFAESGLLFVVGPEGGLSADEVQELEKAGCEGVALGVHVLRTETAGLAALSVAQVTLGKM